MKPNGDFDDKRVGDDEILSVNFSTCKNLAPDESIVSAAWSVTVKDGTDPSPDSMKKGEHTIDGLRVSQMFTGGVAGVTYSPLCTATTSLGQIITLPDPRRGSLLVVS